MSYNNNTFIDEQTIDQMMLESYGITITPKITERINESRQRTPHEKIFGIDKMFVFNLDEVIEDITIRNDIFENFINNEIYKKIDSCVANVLLDMKIDLFINSKLKEYINMLDKGEVLQYYEFFNYLLKDSVIQNAVGNTNMEKIMSNIKYDDNRFELMPHVVRIF